eukprot:3857-Heterococcus_DN1.PRE.1
MLQAAALLDIRGRKIYELNDETFGDGGDFDEEGHLPSFFGAAGDEGFSALMDDLKQTALQGLEADDAAAVFANGNDTTATAAGSDFFSTVGAMSALSIGGPSAQQAKSQQTFAAPTSADAKAEWSVMQKQFEVVRVQHYKLGADAIAHSSCSSNRQLNMDQGDVTPSPHPSP